LLVLFLLTLGGCAGPVLNAQVKPTATKATAATVKSGPRLVYRPGERLDVGVWLRGMPLGKVTLRVGQTCGAAGDEAIEVRSEALAAGPLSEIQGGEAELRSLVDVASGLPIADRWIQRVKRPVEFELQFAADHFWALSRRPTKISPPRKLAVPSPVHDAHTALGLLRSWSGADGEPQHFMLVVGRNLWRAEVVRRGTEEIATTRGEQRAIRVDGVAQRVRPTMELDDKKLKDFALWLSDDDERLPLRMVLGSEWGEIEARLLARKVTAEAEATARSPAELPSGCPAELGPSEPMRQAIAQAEREKQRQMQRAARLAAQRARAAARRGRRATTPDPYGDGPPARRRGHTWRAAGRRGSPGDRLWPSVDASEAPLDSLGRLPPAR
jgi:hypothetical protein